MNDMKRLISLWIIAYPLRFSDSQGIYVQSVQVSRVYVFSRKVLIPWRHHTVVKDREIQVVVLNLLMCCCGQQQPPFLFGIITNNK